MAVIEGQRGLHDEYVFPYGEHRVTRMHNSAWKRVRKKAAEDCMKVLGRSCPEGFLNIRVHDLRHTFGRRLRAEDVSFEDREDLLGHKSDRITTPYSAAELRNLVTAANKVCRDDSRKTPAQHEVRDEQESYAQGKMLEMKGIVVATGGLEPPTPAL